MEDVIVNRYTEFEIQYKDSDLNHTIRAFDVVEQQLEEITAQVKKLQAEYDYLRLVKIPDLFDENDPPLKNLSFQGLGRVQLTGDIYCSVRKENKEKLHTWLDETGRADLITPTVNASTLKAVIKNLIKQGEPYPHDIIQVTPFSRASLVRRV